MGLIKTLNRDQLIFSSLDSWVDENSIARIIDAFVEPLNLLELGFSTTGSINNGRPAYDPKALLKLYIYGNEENIRSSRRLSKACSINLEAKWLMQGLEPDHRTINDFRKINAHCLKNVFHEFNSKLAHSLPFGYQSVDGSKFQACNSKDNNFTFSKLDDRIKRLDDRYEDYMRQLDLADKDEHEILLTEDPTSFSKEVLKEKVKDCLERKALYESYLNLMNKNNLSQLSLTDPDSKLMKTRNGFSVAYNVQTAVDSETHLIRDYQLTDHPADTGLLASTLSNLKQDEAILEAVADKGYIDKNDISNCLEQGIIPNVIPEQGKDSYELEIEYNKCDNVETLKDNTDSNSIKNCLHAGIIPTAYNDILADIEIFEKTITTRILLGEDKYASLNTQAQLKERASEGYFVMDFERNCVYCPAGEILRKKSIKPNGNVRYANKYACKRCKHKDRCTSASFKEVDFQDKVQEKSSRFWWTDSKAIEKREYKLLKEQKNMVRMVFKPNRQKMDNRKCLSEHPFGTIKRAMNSHYFLLRGKRKVTGEFALFALGYNLKRAMNLLEFKDLIAIMG
jgi:transposase